MVNIVGLCGQPYPTSYVIVSISLVIYLIGRRVEEGFFPAMIGIVFVCPFIGLCHLFYLLFLFFSGNKKRVKPHFVSVLCSLALFILSYVTLQLGYFPSV